MDHEYDYISEYRNIMKSIFQVTEKTKKVQEFYREFTNRVYKSLTSRVYKELLKYLSGPDTILENWKQDAKLKISDIPERIISEYNNSLQLAKNSIKTIVPVIKNIKPENHDQKEYLAFLFDDLISLLDPNTIANSSKSMRRKLDAILKELKDDIDKILYMLSNFYKQIIYAEEYMSYEICLKRSGLKILLGLFDLTDHTDIVEELRKIDSKLRNWCIHKRMFDEEEITPKMLELDHWWWLSKEQIEK
uniref:Uncharacterized protein n=1 Tax=Acrobeloides nanus TaxID=290746 RepID=A0A914CBB3_9BILA